MIRRGWEVFAAVFFFLSWFILTVFSISMWNQSGQCSIRCRYAAGILWPSPGWRRGSTSSRATRGHRVDGARVTSREARRGTQGALLFETDIYILQNYLSEGKWNLLKVVWDKKQRDESLRDVQKDNFFCGPERLFSVLSYWAMTSYRPEKFPGSAILSTFRTGYRKSLVWAGSANPTSCHQAQRRHNNHIQRLES